MMTFKVMTFNICSCHNLKYDYVPDQTIRTIVNENPDIIAINEMDKLNERNGFTDMPAIMAEQTGYNYYFGKSIDYRGGEYGNMIMSRHPIISAVTIPIPQTDGGENRSIIKACVNIDGQFIDVLVSHYGLSFAERIHGVNTTLDLLGENPLIFMGDLNCTPDSGELDNIYAKLTDISAAFTFPSDKPNQKIDYIFVSPQLKAISATVIDTQVSDHRPYTAIISC